MSRLRSRIKSLDGLRAISIFLVLFAHVAWAGPKAFPVPKEWVLGYLNVGDLGVRIFFVISGFLITDILIKEYSHSGTISLTRFYFRRFLRIFPAFYAFLLVITALASMELIPTTTRELVYAWTYTENYQPRFTWSEGHWFIGHSWSLAVEEQFYLLWPGVFVLTGLKGARYSAIAFVLIAPIIRVFYALGSTLFPFLDAQPLYLFLVACSGRSFETVADAIAIGCLLTLFRESLWKLSWYRYWLHSRLFGVTFIVLLSCGMLDGYVLRAWSDTYAFRILYEAAGVSIMNVCIAMIIDRSIRFPQTTFGKFLNLPVISGIGVISYSLYLWQELFLYRYKENYLNYFPATMIYIFAAALFSYFLIEKPFLKLRDKFVRE